MSLFDGIVLFCAGISGLFYILNLASVIGLSHSHLQFYTCVLHRNSGKFTYFKYLN
jgi:hypothetical protein